MIACADLTVQLRQQQPSGCGQHFQRPPQLRAPPAQVQDLMADVGQVEVPEVAAEVAGVVQLAQSCASADMALLEGSYFTLQDGFGVNPAIGVLTVCSSKEACSTRVVVVELVQHVHTASTDTRHACAQQCMGLPGLQHPYPPWTIRRPPFRFVLYM